MPDVGRVCMQDMYCVSCCLYDLTQLNDIPASPHLSFLSTFSHLSPYPLVILRSLVLPIHTSHLNSTTYHTSASLLPASITKPRSPFLILLYPPLPRLLCHHTTLFASAKNFPSQGTEERPKGGNLLPQVFPPN